MKIAIIGAGKVGTTLGQRWSQCGHTLAFGVRDPADSKHQALHPYAKVTHSLEAVESAEVVVLAVHWPSAQSAVEEIADALAGKILIDCTNPVKGDLSGVSIGQTTSAAEQIQSWAPRCTVVKAFNQIGFNIMADPLLEDRKAVLFLAGDIASANSTVESLARELDFDVVVMPSLSDARLLEPLAMIWISMAYKLGYGREFAFSMIHRTTQGGTL